LDDFYSSEIGAIAESFFAAACPFLISVAMKSEAAKKDADFELMISGLPLAVSLSVERFLPAC